VYLNSKRHPGSFTTHILINQAHRTFRLEKVELQKGILDRACGFLDPFAELDPILLKRFQ